MRDHVHCERKAAQSALSLLRSYPNRPDVVIAMARLAHEETAHVIQVAGLLEKRGDAMEKDFGDEYAAALQRHVRRVEPERCLDRLLVFALIEARSAERLALLADCMPDAASRDLYRGLAIAEMRHRDMFVALAQATSPDWQARAEELCRVEAVIVRELPTLPRIH